MMKTKKLYQTPLTERNVVELEGEFCGSITTDAGKGQEIKSVSQGYESIEASSAFQTENGGNGLQWTDGFGD